MYKRILVPLDGSRFSESVLPYARFFAKALKAPMSLLYVVEPEALMPVVSGGGRYDDLLTAETQYRGDYLRNIATSFSDVPAVDRRVDVGKPAEVITDRAAAEAETLIAMATHGRSGIKRWLLGSVAGKVLHATANPLLLVRTDEILKNGDTVVLRKVIVPLDGSKVAEAILPHAVEFSEKMNLEIVLLRIYVSPKPDHVLQYQHTLDRLWEQMRNEAQTYLEETARQLSGNGVRNVSTVLLDGDVAEEKIIDVARNTPQSLIAICTHGRTGVGRWVLGSIADRVVRHSERPVLIIRTSTDRKPKV